MNPHDPEDSLIRCPECGGPLEEVLVLPGGREVLGREVYFSDDVVGVTSFERCRDCEFREGSAADDVDGDRSTTRA